jgi:beta-glucosidase
LNAVATRVNKPVVLLHNVGGEVHLTGGVGLVDPFLVVWQCGSHSGERIAEVVSGRQSPSGKVPMTFLTSMEERSAVSWPGIEAGREEKLSRKAVEMEGVYIGYRYVDIEWFRENLLMKLVMAEFSRFRDSLSVPHKIENVDKTKLWGSFHI